MRIKSAYKVRRALINKGIIGVSVRSLFYDPDNQVVRKSSDEEGSSGEGSDDNNNRKLGNMRASVTPPTPPPPPPPAEKKICKINGIYFSRFMGIILGNFILGIVLNK